MVTYPVPPTVVGISMSTVASEAVLFQICMFLHIRIDSTNWQQSWKKPGIHSCGQTHHHIEENTKD